VARCAYCRSEFRDPVGHYYDCEPMAEAIGWSGVEDAALREEAYEVGLRPVDRETASRRLYRSDREVAAHGAP
jgi:hypothetical protein